MEKQFTYSIITLSDKGAKGLREDKNKSIIKNIMSKNGYVLEKYILILDDKDILKKSILSLYKHSDIILTNGGTGVSPRDITPDVTVELIDRRLYGFETLIMLESLKITRYAAISRAICGIKGNTIIVNLPGSPKAVSEQLGIIVPILQHTLDKINGDETDCANIEKMD